MNILILGDKYDKGKKSQGSQGLLNYKSNTKYIDYYNNTIQECFPRSNIVYVYGLGEKKFLSYYNDNKSLKKISIIYNPHYETKNEVYSLFLCRNNIIQNQDTLIINGNNVLKKNTIQKISKCKNSSVFLAKQNTSHDIGCIYNSSRVLNISYNLDTVVDNVYFVSKSDQKTILDLINSSANHNKFIFEIFNTMIDKKILINLI